MSFLDDEIISVYASSYRGLQDSQFELMTELAKLKGSITALSEMDDSPEFVFKQLKEIVKNFK